MSQVSKPVRTATRPPVKRPIGWPWNDRAGRFSWLKTVLLISLTIPGVVALVSLLTGNLGARPVNQVIHVLGLWAIRLLLISLAITPLRQIFNRPKLMLGRRMVGVAAFVYLALHFIGYIVDENFDLGKVASEIVLRLYLTIGFVALAIMAALAITSTDGMVRRLGGRRWQNLHRFVYLAALLGSIHYFMQSKLNVYEPIVMGGVLIWLMAYRSIGWLSNFRRAATFTSLLLLAIGAAIVTALGEALYYELVRNIDFMRVFSLDWSFVGGIRPAHVVLIGLLTVALGKLLLDVVQTKLRHR